VQSYFYYKENHSWVDFEMISINLYNDKMP